MIQRSALAFLLVIGTVLVVNEPTLEYGFVYDDRAVVLERSPVWTLGWDAFLSDRTFGVGRHLTLVSLDLDRREPLSPRPFHVTNVALSALVALLVVAVAASLGLPYFAAVASALAFAVHPTHVDAVVSIVGRAELLAALGVLGALLLHVNGYFGRASLVALAGVLFLAALSSKESAASLPLLLGLAELFRIRRAGASPKPRAWPLAYVIALVAWLFVVADNFATIDPIPYIDNPLAHAPTFERVTRAGELLWRYVSWAVWPLGLKPDRGYAEIGATTQYGPTAWIAWAALALAAFALRIRAPRLGFSLLWLPASFAVTGNVLVPIGTLMAERLLFLPTVGPCLVLGIGVAALLATPRRWLRVGVRKVVPAALLALAISYDHRARVWADDAHYHAQAVALSPRSAKAHYDFGLSLARSERYDEAEREFGRALAIVPDSASATYYRAESLRRLGRHEDAAAAYAAYLRLMPNDVDVLRVAAESEAAAGRFDRALERMRAAVALAPERAELVAELTHLEARARAAAQSLNASSTTGSR